MTDSTQPGPTPPAERRPERSRGRDGSVLELVRLAARAATGYERTDLADRLGKVAERLADPDVQILVVGEFKQGKSTLVNALVGFKICPVDDDIATAVPTVVHHGPRLRSVVTHRRTGPGDSTGRDLTETEIAFEQVASQVVEGSASGTDVEVERIDVWVDSPFLADGVTLVDTPGVGGIGSPYTATTIGALPLADALVFVSDASQELTRPEMDFLSTARGLCPNTVMVLSKRDLYPEWRTILARNADHLRTAGLAIEQLAVSPVVFGMARNTGSDRLLVDSGFSSLVDHLRDEVIDRARRGAGSDALAVAASAVGQIESQLENERAALADPDAAAGLVGELERARAAAGDLRSQAARWQTTLGDGITDLTADVDVDLRARLRDLSREAADALADVDPTSSWDEFEPWLRRRTMATVAENYSMLHGRAEDLAVRVGEHFGVDADEIAGLLNVPEPETLVGAVSVDRREDEGGPGVAARAFTGMRASYGGMLMFGMVTNLAGIGLLNPVTALAGVALGRKAIRDEKKRRLDQLRAKARSEVQRYVDEVTLHVSADSRRTLRTVQRTLRDHYSELAAEVDRSATESLSRAEAAVRQDAAGRARRVKALEEELGRVRALAAKVRAGRQVVASSTGSSS